MRFDFAIVGAGLTGTSMLCQLVAAVRRRVLPSGRDPAGITVRIFEKQAEFGPGFPHHPAQLLPFHITNMCAHEMGIQPDDPADFQKWVNARREALADRFPGLREADADGAWAAPLCRHYPRAVMGAYLQARFGDAVRDAARVGLGLRLHPATEVIDMREDSAGVAITARNRSDGKVSRHRAQGVLLATGHWFKNGDRDGFFPSPWPAPRLRDRIPTGGSVAVVGTSLSAIETVLTLTSGGRFTRRGLSGLVYEPPPEPHRIVLHSRRGLLPRVRGRTGDYRCRHLTKENVERILAENEGRLSLGRIGRLLTAELETAYGRPFEWHRLLGSTMDPAKRLQRDLRIAKTGDGPDGCVRWQTVLRRAAGLARPLYLALSANDRHLFDQRWATEFFAHAATLPVVNAEKLHALMRCGLVRIVRLGCDYRYRNEEATGRHIFVFRDRRGRRREAVYRHVVDARGQPRSVWGDPSPLIGRMLRSGTLETEKIPWPGQGEGEVKPRSTDSVWIDPQTHRVMRQGPGGTEPSRAIYAVGAITRGQIIDTSMARGLVRSTAAIADALAEQLAGGDGGCPGAGPPRFDGRRGETYTG